MKYYDVDRYQKGLRSQLKSTKTQQLPRLFNVDFALDK